MKRIIYLLTILPLFFLAGCNNDEFGVPDKPATSGGDIVFNISIDSKPQTRVATDAQFKSTWENGDEIGLFAVKRASGNTKALAITGNYIHNVKLTYSDADGGKWTGEAYYTNDGEVLDFYAYYPYDATATDPINITFNVLADQSIEANYNLSDLLSATPVKGIAKGTAVDLTFAHKLALVQVEVDPGTMKGSGPSEHLVLTLRGCKAGGAFNLGDGTLSTAGDAVAVKMLRVEKSTDANYESKYTYRALVPAQTVTSGTSLCLMAQGGQLYSTPKLAAPLDLTASAAKLYNAKLPVTALQTVKIPAGTFLMGSSDGTNIDDGDGSGLNTTAAEPNRYTDETQHKVTLTKDFYMSKYEITFAQYDAYCDATGKANPGDQNWGRGDLPVINVSWDDAVAYCAWLSEETGFTYRLPTEAEWEYACRGGKANHPFGIGTGTKLTGDMANFNGRYIYNNGHQDLGSGNGIYLAQTQLVGSYAPNAWGLYDMHGNVWEWCSDWHDAYGSTAITDPTGPTSGNYRVLRGGSWINYAQDCRSAYRDNYFPGHRSNNVGFRVVFVP